MGYVVGRYQWGMERSKSRHGIDLVCVGYNISSNIVNLVFVFKQVR